MSLNSRKTLLPIIIISLFLLSACSFLEGEKTPWQAYLPLESGDASQAGIASKALNDMDEVIEEAIQAGDAPGGVLLIARDNKVVYHKAYGNRRVKPTVEPMTRETIFDLASCSKILGTSAMTMLLIQDGNLSLDTKVADIIPQFAQEGKDDVTVWNLLTHTSGLPAYCSWQKAEELRGDKTTADALIDYIASLEKRYPTGEYYTYSCLNFLTLARVNENTAGESMHSFLKRRIWNPLGMTSTGYLLTEEQIARTAPTSKGDVTSGVGIVHDPLANYHKATIEHCPGNAGLFMSAGDMAIMAQLILNRGMYNGIRIYRPDIVELWTSPQIVKPKYDPEKEDNKGEMNRRALGWIVYLDEPYVTDKAPDASFIGHTGWTGTYIWIDKFSGTFMIFNTNTVHPEGPPKIHPYRKRLTPILINAIDIYSK